MGIHFHHYYNLHPSSLPSFYHEAATSKANSRRIHFFVSTINNLSLFLLCMFKPNYKKSEVFEFSIWCYCFFLDRIDEDEEEEDER
ncbi:hypothetical protein MTR_2g054230 [Medicago truncatula]|uniref:Uncharacterized protein n=1 Tax=Medicago truncatula TaxID=3880 RepID=G7IQJ4_MEDTR|nr:hypothetical protein MTR_2g054230 [Medicago truncatula]